MENDRRRNPRVRVDVSGEVFLGDKGFPALVLNISLGGCLIETPARPRIGEIVSLRVGLDRVVQEVKLKVVWQSYGQGLGKIGTRFYGMTEEEVLVVVAGILSLSLRKP